MKQNALTDMFSELKKQHRYYEEQDPQALAAGAVEVCIHIVQQHVEKDLARRALDLVKSLREHGCTIASAEASLFNFDQFQAAKKLRLRKDVLEIIQIGMKFEYIVDFSLNNYEEMFSDIETIANHILGKTD